ncbi:hypothetical protein [Vibrio fluvialis]|uniref:hypothetical protein n=1 Tax=Vibrio fluvialis TaxID=676 RepID=UPI0023A98B4A|nr:hypothetical protein [Vibrio fluvialis]MDE5179186.1 hypothetical protein [Vibrio fluvialis]
MSVPTFEQRRAKILTLADLENQITLARTYVKKLRTKAKKQSSLAAKLKVNEDIKLAEKVVRELRLKSFDIEDELIARAATGG